MKLARAIATPSIPLYGGGKSGAELVLGNEWRGLGIDFLDNTYAIQRTPIGAETLLGAGPNTPDNGLGLDFTDNTSAVRS